MTDQKEEKLKKRVQGDGTCSIIIAGCKGFLAVANLVEYVLISIGKIESYEAPALILETAIYNFLICIIFILLTLMLRDINKNGRPFTKVNTSRLRWMTLLTAVCAIVPNIATAISAVVQNNEAFQMTFSVGNQVALLIGVVIGIISEIFHYGCELQAEMDCIA